MNLGRRRISNSELGAIFEAMGMTRVALFLASGNAIFDAGSRSALEAFIADQLQAALDYPVPTYVRSASEVQAIAAHRPFTDAELAASTGKIQIIFHARPLDGPARAQVMALSCADDRLAIGAREIYWLPRGPMSQSTLDLKAIERATGGTTIRTRNTIVRIAARFF